MVYRNELATVCFLLQQSQTPTEHEVVFRVLKERTVPEGSNFQVEMDTTVFLPE